MARIGLCGGSYTSQSVNADAQFTMNLYPEQIESGQGKSAMALYPTPGKSLYVTMPESPIWGLAVQQSRIGGFQSDTVYAIAGSGFYQLAPAAFPPWIKQGTLVSTPPTAVPIAAGVTGLFFTDGAGRAYSFSFTGIFTTIPAGTLNNILPNCVGYCDGFFLTALFNPKNQVQASAPLDATTWPATSIDTENIFPDAIVSMIVDHREMWLFGRQRSIVYYDAGTAPFPLQVISSGTIEQGISAPGSVVRLDNSVFWLGGDERGNGMAWRAQGYTPSRVSNHAVEFAWSQYPTISDAVGYSYQDQGHSFWVLYFPTANHTWVYDVATGMWHERGYLNADGITFSADRTWNHVLANGIHLVGDPLSGNIYQMSIGTMTDNGNPIKRIRRSPHVSTENEWIFHHQLQLDMETGLGTGPAIPVSTGLSSLILQDASLADWLITVDDNAFLHSASTTGTPSAAVFLNDSVIPSTTWQLGVNTSGLLTLTSVTFNPSAPTVLAMNSTPTGFVIAISVSSGLIRDSRGPQVFLRWSDDGGHTWSNYHGVDVGNLGQYKTRAMWRRLGRSRDRVYEISAQDPIPWRFLEEDLLATPGFAPSERISKQYVKVT